MSENLQTEPLTRPKAAGVSRSWLAYVVAILIGARRGTRPTQPERSLLLSTERRARVGYGLVLACLIAIGTVSYSSVVWLRQDTQRAGIDLLIGELEGTEQTPLREREVRAERAATLTKTLIVGTGAVAVVAVAVGLYLIGQGFTGSRFSEAEPERRVRERAAELTRANEALTKSRTMFERLF